MKAPRGVEERIRWFLANDPSGVGMCAQHTWHALGGNYGNPPAWRAASANAAIAKVKASGRYWTPKTWFGPPPRGAWVGYQYGEHGHACLSMGDGRIATTDPAGRPGKTGVESINYPSKWGASGWTVWTDQYNGVRFPVGGSTVASLSLKETAKREFRTNTVVKLDIDGKTQFRPPFTGWADLSLYANVDVPPALVGGKPNPARKHLSNGGVRAWFQEYSASEADRRDETGYSGPWSPPRFGDQHLLIAHEWQHTVDADFWEFCIYVSAYDDAGKPVDIPLTLQTREVKIVSKR